MNFWHMQLHEGDFRNVETDDIRKILSYRLIGCSGDPVSLFNQIQPRDIVLVRHGGTVVALVEAESRARDVLPHEKDENIWFDRCVKVKVLREYENLRISGNGWFLPKTLMPVDNPIAYSFIQKLYIEIQMQTITDLLKYKKQIILQGPPGTGKTRLAKEIAREMLVVQTITESEIKANISVGLKVNSADNHTEYTIKAVGDYNISIGLKNSSNEYKPSYKEIIKAYEIKMWDGKQIGGNDPYAAAIAKYIFTRLPLEQFKIVQFHPSFSYEDFVRGIVAESKGDKIEYKNVNKIFGQFATEARRNWEDSKKDIGKISKEIKVRQYFEQFADDLEVKISSGSVISLTPSVNILDVEDDAFRYKGNAGWSSLGNRMLFKDIIQAFLDGNKVRQDIKKNKNLSGLAIQHASYFVRVLNMFQDYLITNNLGFDQVGTEKVEPRNYVIIIDEINRANLSSVLGELIYALEYRDEQVESMYAVEGKNELILPPNLYIIGTMNTADRSVGHIDYAIRRRFAFVDVLPKVLDKDFETALFKRVSELFVKDISAKELEPSEHLSSEFKAKDVWLGHSYFIKKKDIDSRVRLQYEILPILEEYIKDGVLKESQELKKIINNLENEIA